MSRYNIKFHLTSPNDKSVFITRRAIAIVLFCVISAMAYIYGPAIIASWNELKPEEGIALIKSKEITDVLGLGHVFQLTARNGRVYMVRYDRYTEYDARELMDVTKETGTPLRGAADADTRRGWTYSVKYFPRTTLVFIAIAAVFLLGAAYWGFFVKV